MTDQITSCACCDRQSTERMKIIRRQDREHAAMALPPGWFFAHTPKGVGHVYLCSEECASWYLDKVCCPKACLETEECDHAPEPREPYADHAHDVLWISFDPVFGKRAVLNEVYTEDPGKWALRYRLDAPSIAPPCPNRDWCEEHQVCHACQRAKRDCEFGDGCIHADDLFKVAELIDGLEKLRNEAEQADKLLQILEEIGHSNPAQVVWEIMRSKRRAR